MENKITTIKLREKTKKLLADCGQKGETYEQIVLNLINKKDETKN